MTAYKLLLLLMAAGIASAAWAGKVSILRDEWGVPHIFADRMPAACYGLGWAQAEDRLEQLLRNYRFSAGTMAEAFGSDWVDHDWRRRLVGQQYVCKARYKDVPADVRAAIEAFQAGIKAYMAQHPDEVPAWAPEIEPWMVPALGREIIFNWPVGQAEDELGRRGEVDFEFSSNQWAVAPQRTEPGCAFFCIDPHIPWDGIFRFYEFRLHAGDVHQSGFGPLGAPTLGLGHNDRLGWACTTGGPDTTDVYVEQINPENPLQYRYDGEWREMTTRDVTINVAGGEPVTRTVESTHHGPVMLREGNRAYTMACPYLDQVDLVTQLYRMGTARNLGEFKAAIGMLQLMEQNTMYADVKGNIFYCRTGRVPVRPEGFDFSKPVPGNTSRSEWQGLHDMADLVQLENPERGYMQNCNIGPDTMLVDCPIRPKDYPAYIYNAPPGQSNSRGRRAVELLEAANKLTLKQALAIAVDTHAEGAEEWQRAMADAAEGFSEEELGNAAGLREALTALAEWDGLLEVNAIGGPFYRALREMAREVEPRPDNERIMQGKPLPDDQEASLREAAVKAAEYLNEKFGKTVLPWGDIHRVKRGDRSWPAAGGDSGGGSTLRAVGTSQGEDGVLYGRSGQSWTQLVIFKPGAVRSYSATPYGQSDRPDSPHYTDQAEQLYSQKKLKDTYFMPGRVKGHVESRTELEWEG
jgi:acyl-homoserine-lactone acylase